MNEMRKLMEAINITESADDYIVDERYTLYDFKKDKYVYWDTYGGFKISYGDEPGASASSDTAEGAKRKLEILHKNHAGKGGEVGRLEKRVRYYENRLKDARAAGDKKEATYVQGWVRGSKKQLDAAKKQLPARQNELKNVSVVKLTIIHSIEKIT